MVCLCFKIHRQDILDEIDKFISILLGVKTRLYNMIRDRGDWVISRQRAWGVPLPIFYAEDGTAIMTKEVTDHVANLFEEHGSVIWWQREAKDLLPKVLLIQALQMVNLLKKMTLWMFGLIRDHLGMVF